MTPLVSGWVAGPPYVHRLSDALYAVARSMESVKLRYTDLDVLIDQVHALFEQWREEGVFFPAIEEETFYQMRLAVHEWLANLVQHADFGERAPEVVLDVYLDGPRLKCVVEDNSAGFDLSAGILTRQEVLQRFPERGMGLLMLDACTDDLAYYALGDGRNRLEFYVSPNQDPWLNIPF